MASVGLSRNSPTQVIIDDIVTELGGGGASISQIDQLKIYSGATLIATLTPTVTRYGSDIIVEAQYTNNTSSDITIDKTEVWAGGKVYFVNSQTYTIVVGETKNIKVTITVDMTPLDSSGNIAIAKRLSGEQTTTAHLGNVDLITYDNNTGQYALVDSLTPTITYDTTNNTITIQASYTPSASVSLSYIGVRINGIAADPTVPSGYGYLATDTSSLAAGVQYNITVTLTIS